MKKCILLAFMAVQVCPETKTVPCSPVPQGATYYMGPLCYEIGIKETIIKKGITKDQAVFIKELFAGPKSPCRVEIRPEGKK